MTQGEAAAANPSLRPPLNTPTVDRERTRNVVDAVDSTSFADILDSRTEGAKECARRGFPVFPIEGPEGGGKEPRVVGRRPDGSPIRFAFTRNSTTDLDVIDGWDLDGRGENFGVYAAGADLLILDEDRPGAVEEWAANLGIAFPPTFTVSTGRGRHLYFRADGTAFSQRDAWPGVNVRHRGYVVGPPSVHETGVVYTVADDREPASLPAEAAAALLAEPEGEERPAHQLASTPGADAYVARTVPMVVADARELAALPVGGRNDRGQGWEEAGGLFNVAARLVELSNADPAGYPIEQAEADFMATAPRGEERRWSSKWSAALDHVGGRTAVVPDAARDFDDLGDGGPTAPDSFEREVAREMARQDVRDEARRRIAARDANGVALPPLARLDEFLDEPDPDVEYRIDSVWPAGGRVVFSAAQKAGKTTTVSNVLRSLADGEDFLGQFRSETVRRAILIDDELDENMLRRWLRDQGITNTDRIELVTLRGRLSSFNIMEPETRARWARHLGSADVLLFDCLRPALDALGLDENHDAGRFLEAFDELLVEAGIPEAVVVHHMGHGSERSRGDSRILDWPDAVWKLVRGEDELANQRFFSAYGRDVQVPESQLAFDEVARRLSVVGGSRKEQKLTPAIEAVLQLLHESKEPLSGGALEKALTAQDFGRNIARDAVKGAVARRLVTAAPQGPGKPTLHSLAVDDFDPVEGEEEP